VPGYAYRLRFESFGTSAEVESDELELLEAATQALPPDWSATSDEPLVRFGINAAGVITLDGAKCVYGDVGYSDAAIVRVQRRELGPSADARAAFGRRVDDEFVRPRDRLPGELADLSLSLEDTRCQLIAVTAALTAARSDSAGARPRFLDRLAGWTNRARGVFRARHLSRVVDLAQ
jgi:hypothetical protein